MKSESYGAFSGPSTNDDGVLIVPADGDDLPPDYRPTAGEEFMNPRQLAYFRKKLLIWKDEILKESEATLEALKAEPLREPDLTDRAASETDWGIELRTRERQRKLIGIERLGVAAEAVALQRLDDQLTLVGTDGFFA